MPGLTTIQQCVTAGLLTIFALITAATAGPGDGTGFGFSDTGSKQKSADELVKIELTSDAATIQPGKRFHLAVVFDIEPKWHIYWKNPGDSGAATDIRVSAPDGFELGETRFTRPERFEEGRDITFGYAKQAVLFVPITAPEKLNGERFNFQANINFLVCKNICLIGRASKDLSLSSAGEGDGAEQSVPKVVREHQKRLPKSIDDWPGGEARFDGSTLTITGPAESFDTVEFFPVERPGVTFEDAQTHVRDGQVRVTASVNIKPANAQGEPLKVVGLVALGSKLSDPSYEFSIEVEQADHSH